MQSTLQMEGQIVTTSSPNLCPKDFTKDANVLLVDDDATSLAIVSRMVRTFQYQVKAAKNGHEAMDTLRKHSIDLVLADIYMPEMDGFELLKLVNKEFKIPVILMSVDHQEKIVLRTLKEGAALFIPKPVTLADISNIWQYALRKKLHCHEKITIRSPLQIKDNKSKTNKRKISEVLKVEDENNGGDENQKGSQVGPKKPRIVWNGELQKRFLGAVEKYGLEGAVPMKILSFMKVPGLTRENIASHLQKHRINVKNAAAGINSVRRRGWESKYHHYANRHHVSNQNKVAGERHEINDVTSLITSLNNQINLAVPSPISSRPFTFYGANKTTTSSFIAPSVFEFQAKGKQPLFPVYRPLQNGMNYFTGEPSGCKAMNPASEYLFGNMTNNSTMELNFGGGGNNQQISLTTYLNNQINFGVPSPISSSPFSFYGAKKTTTSSSTAPSVFECQAKGKQPLFPVYRPLQNGMNYFTGEPSGCKAVSPAYEYQFENRTNNSTMELNFGGGGNNQQILSNYGQQQLLLDPTQGYKNRERLLQEPAPAFDGSSNVFFNGTWNNSSNGFMGSGTNQFQKFQNGGSSQQPRPQPLKLPTSAPGGVFQWNNVTYPQLQPQHLGLPPLQNHAGSSSNNILASTCNLDAAYGFQSLPVEKDLSDTFWKQINISADHSQVVPQQGEAGESAYIYHEPSLPVEKDLSDTFWKQINISADHSQVVPQQGEAGESAYIYHEPALANGAKSMLVDPNHTAGQQKQQFNSNNNEVLSPNFTFSGSCHVDEISHETENQMELRQGIKDGQVDQDSSSELDELLAWFAQDESRPDVAEALAGLNWDLDGNNNK